MRSLERSKRIVELIDMLKSRPWSVRELAEYFHKSTRTIERDIKALAELGETPIQVKRGLYKLQSKASSLNPVEALAVHAATRLLYHQAPAVNKHYIKAMDKLAAMLPEPAKTLTQESIRPLKKTGDDRALELVAQAWFNQTYLFFEYRAAGSKNWHPNELAVYFVEVNRNNLGLYTIGYERSFHKAVRTFKLSRMRNIRLSSKPNDKYTIPENFSPKEFLRNAWGLVGGEKSVRVRLKFVPEAAPRVLEQDFPGLTIEAELPDGSLIASLEVGVDNEGFPTEILPWVQSWGPRVEVLEPENLRRRWREEALALAEKFATLDVAIRGQS